MLRGQLAGLLALCCWVGAPRNVSAQDTAPNAHQHFTDAKALLADGDHERGCVAVVGAAKTEKELSRAEQSELRYMAGQCHFHGQRFGPACNEFGKSLALQPQPGLGVVGALAECRLKTGDIGGAYIAASWLHRQLEEQQLQTDPQRAADYERAQNTMQTSRALLKHPVLLKVAEKPQTIEIDGKPAWRLNDSCFATASSANDKLGATPCVWRKQGAQWTLRVAIDRSRSHRVLLHLDDNSKHARTAEATVQACESADGGAECRGQEVTLQSAPGRLTLTFVGLTDTTKAKVRLEGPIGTLTGRINANAQGVPELKVGALPPGDYKLHLELKDFIVKENSKLQAGENSLLVRWGEPVERRVDIQKKPPMALTTLLLIAGVSAAVVGGLIALDCLEKWVPCYKNGKEPDGGSLNWRVSVP